MMETQTNWFADVVAIFVIRAIYINSGEYAVVDKLGIIWESGSYNKCKSWVKFHDKEGTFYSIKRVG